MWQLHNAVFRHNSNPREMVLSHLVRKGESDPDTALLTEGWVDVQWNANIEATVYPVLHFRRLTCRRTR